MATADVGKSLRTKLLSYNTITDLISQRMYPSVLLQNARMPAVVYTKISTRREHTLSDVTRLAHSRFQFDCYSNTLEEANDIAHAIRRSGICAYQGTTSGIYFCGTEVDSGDSYDQEPPSDGNQEHRYITSFDLLVHYQEAA
jgi:hypothetical protein